MPLLEEVDVTFCSIKNVSPLSHCKRLQKLGIGGNEGIKDLSPLCQYPDLKELDIGGLFLIKDLSFFERGFAKLRFLYISYSLPVDDVSPLTRLRNLGELICRSQSLPPSYPLQDATSSRIAHHCSQDAMDLDSYTVSRTPIAVEADEEDDFIWRLRITSLYSTLAT
jgi:hypothetical protein